MHKASLTILFVLFVTACNPIPPEPRIEPSSPTAASTHTPVASGTEPTPTPMATVAGLSIPVLTAQAVESGVELSWTAVPGAVRYELMTWWDEGTGWQPIGGDSLTGTSYTHTDVRAGIAYYYSIRAVNAAGETSDWLVGDYPSVTTVAVTTAETATPTATALPATVLSLDVAGPKPLTSIGETAQLSVTANMSDGSIQTVENALVQWKSSDLAVVTVSRGEVTAVSPGNVTIAAVYGERTAEVPVSVRISRRAPGTVRVLYASPSDREFRADYSEGIAHALVDLQSWYRRELGGPTFSLYQATPEWCQMSESEAFYASGNSWNKVLAGVLHCAPVTNGISDFVWIIYVDVEEDCDEYPNHELGAGGPGLTIVARGDLEGLTNPGEYYSCHEGPYQGPLGRWIGGLGHELAHAFEVPHPPGCDPWHPTTCNDLEAESLMHYGYSEYPETYLLPADKEILTNSPFIAPIAMREPLAGPPVALGLDPFYEKYLNAGGLPVVASSDVPNAALFRVRDIVDEMLAHSDDLRATLAEQGVRVAVMSNSSVLTDLPEFSDLTEFSPGVSWDERTRGGGVGPTSQRPLVAIATENLLCYQNDVFPHEDIFVHEFAHGVLTMGVQQGAEGEQFRRRLEAAYQDALASGLWSGTYAGTNADEYWAEGVQSWFDLNNPPSSDHNEINTRAELEAYDPVLAGLIREVFGDVTISSSCHEVVDIQEYYRIQGAVVGPEGQPLQGIGLWAWQGELHNSGSAVTRPDGTFDIRIPPGSFTLDIYADFDAGCTFVGWYGPGGFTTDFERITMIRIEDANVSGIEIRLPKEPDELPRIEHCS